jgi:hypothetical protein
MHFHLTRTLRTPYSERFLLSDGDGDFAALDIHYLLDGRVNATVAVFDGAKLRESDLPALLARIDDMLLPDVSVEENNLIFTVVMGKVVGAFTAGA